MKWLLYHWICWTVRKGKMVTVRDLKTCGRVKLEIKVFLTLLNLMVRLMRRPPYPRGISPIAHWIRSWIAPKYVRRRSKIDRSSVPSDNRTVIPQISYLSPNRLRLKCDGTRAVTRFRLSAKWTSPYKSVEGGWGGWGGVSSFDYWQPRCSHQR
jgi:hypothetical protein